MFTNISHSFMVEEAYVPPKNVGGRYRFSVRTLSVSAFKDLLSNPVMVGFLSVVFVSLAFLNVFVYNLDHIFGMVLTGVTCLFLGWVVMVLIRVNQSMAVKKASEVIVLKDGWYPDPWAFGEPNRLRKFEGNRWTEDVKLFRQNG